MHLSPTTLHISVYRGSRLLRTVTIAHQTHIPAKGDVIEVQTQNLGVVTDRSFKYTQTFIPRSNSDHGLTVYLETELPPE